MPTAVIPEEMVGEGDFLVFPGVQSCLAIIGVTSNSLIGGHKTFRPQDPTVENLKDYMGDRHFRSLFLVGWVVEHDLNEIKLQLGRNIRTYAYDISRKGHQDVCLTARFVNLNSRPIIDFAKTTAVTAQQGNITTRKRKTVTGYDFDLRLDTASGGQFAAKSTHKLKKNYVLI